jgi:hypothetical protein
LKEVTEDLIRAKIKLSWPPSVREVKFRVKYYSVAKELLGADEI